MTSPQRRQRLRQLGMAFEHLDPVESLLFHQAELPAPAGQRQMGHRRRQMLVTLRKLVPIPARQRILGNGPLRLVPRQPLAPHTHMAGLPAGRFGPRRQLQGLLQQFLALGVVALQLGPKCQIDQPLGLDIFRAGRDARVCPDSHQAEQKQRGTHASPSHARFLETLPSS